MSCYTPWDAGLEKGSDQYNDEKFFIEIQLDTTKRAIDYYYTQKYRCAIPNALYQSPVHWAYDADNRFKLLPNQALPDSELQIIHDIAHYLLCNGIDYQALNDQISLLDIYDSPTEGGYARVIKIVSDIIRSHFSWVPPYVT